MKRYSAFICIVMCICLILCTSFLCFASSATVSINRGQAALQAQFSRDVGPKTNGYAIDYSYFSPVDDVNDTHKYPLTIFLAGALEGSYEGKELTANEFSNWSSKEYQARFSGGGAFLLIARAPEEQLLLWNSETLIEPLKAAIDDFIVKNPNVDKNRISIVGWCIGARGAVNMALAYPDFFAAIVPVVPNFVITQSDAKALSDMPVWLFGCKTDSYSFYSAYITPSWKNLKEYAKDKENVRFTSFDSAPGNIFQNHNLWLMISYDMNSSNPDYSGMKTVDANNKSVKMPETGGMISWISSMSTQRPIISPSQLSAFINTITNFFSQLRRMILDIFHFPG